MKHFVVLHGSPRVKTRGYKSYTPTGFLLPLLKEFVLPKAKGSGECMQYSRTFNAECTPSPSGESWGEVFMPANHVSRFTEYKITDYKSRITNYPATSIRHLATKTPCLLNRKGIQNDLQITFGITPWIYL
jgi:hypothetical protein